MIAELIINHRNNKRPESRADKRHMVQEVQAGMREKYKSKRQMLGTQAGNTRTRQVTEESNIKLNGRDRCSKN